MGYRALFSRHQDNDGHGYPTLPNTRYGEQGNSHASDRLQCHPATDMGCGHRVAAIVKADQFQSGHASLEAMGAFVQ
jgi:hypothetical protein